MRTESDADVKRPVDFQFNGRSKRVHALAFEADVELECVPAFLKADPPRENADQTVRALAARASAPANAIFHIFDTGILFRALRELDHTQAVDRREGRF